MRNLILVIAACFGTMLAGCSVPCSGCRLCSYTTAGAAGSGQVAGAQIGCAVGSFTAALQPACEAPAEYYAAEPGCDAPTLSGGGHCGQSTSTTYQILKDWQQSTGVADAGCAVAGSSPPVCSAPVCSDPACSAPACSAPTACATGNAPCCAAPHGFGGCTCGSNPAACSCSEGGSSCQCGTALGSTPIEMQPIVEMPPATIPESPAQGGPLSPQTAVGQHQGPQEAGVIHEEDVFAPPVDESSSSITDPFPPQIKKPVHPYSEGVPLDGYPGKGCPVHQHATSPEKPDVSSVPKKHPRSGLSGVLVGGGFDTNGSRKRKLVVRPVSRVTPKTATTKTAAQRTQANPASESPFDWKPKPKVQIQSEGWSATSVKAKVADPNLKPTPESSEKPLAAVHEVQLLPIPPEAPPES